MHQGNVRRIAFYFISLVLLLSRPSHAGTRQPDATAHGSVRIHILSDALEHGPRALGFRAEKVWSSDGRVIRWSEKHWDRSPPGLWPAPTAYLLHLDDSTLTALYDNPHVYRRLSVDSVRTVACRWARDRERRLQSSELPGVVTTCTTETLGVASQGWGESLQHVRLTCRDRTPRFSNPVVALDSLDYVSVTSVDAWLTTPAFAHPAADRAVGILGGESLAAVPGLANIVLDLMDLGSLAPWSSWSRFAAPRPQMQSLCATRQLVRSLIVTVAGPTPHGTDSLRFDIARRALIDSSVAAYEMAPSWSDGVQQRLTELARRFFPATGLRYRSSSLEAWPNVHALTVSGPAIVEVERTARLADDEPLAIPGWMRPARQGDLPEPCAMTPQRPNILRSPRR